MLFWHGKTLMKLGDMAQDGDSGVDNEGDNVDDASTEPSNMGKQQFAVASSRKKGNVKVLHYS